MTKNVIVVDEQGNEYGATYPKRAKGLVKKGRARFIDENTICLACPPNEILEEITMEENKILTKKEVFEQLVKFQNQLTNPNSAQSSPFLSDAIRAVFNEDKHDVIDEHVAEAISDIAGVFIARETTYRKLLDFYIRIYDEIETPADMVQNTFRAISSEIKGSDMCSEDKLIAFKEVTDKVESLLKQIVG